MEDKAGKIFLTCFYSLLFAYTQGLHVYQNFEFIFERFGPIVAYFAVAEVGVGVLLAYYAAGFTLWLHNKLENFNNNDIDKKGMLEELKEEEDYYDEEDEVQEESNEIEIIHADNVKVEKNDLHTIMRLEKYEATDNGLKLVPFAYIIAPKGVLE